tara:strand:- start:88 stop:666 length:579 start_codon:yes stop_codon:yes gene_type:complete
MLIQNLPLEIRTMIYRKVVESAPEALPMDRESRDIYDQSNEKKLRKLNLINSYQTGVQKNVYENTNSDNSRVTVVTEFHGRDMFSQDNCIHYTRTVTDDGNVSYEDFPYRIGQISPGLFLDKLAIARGYKDIGARMILQNFDGKPKNSADILFSRALKHEKYFIMLTPSRGNELSYNLGECFRILDSIRAYA